MFPVQRSRSLINFNPLPPHGGRPNRRSHQLRETAFQSTPSAWRETSTFVRSNPSISFQSTPSAWRETTVGQRVIMEDVFQSTPSAWRETMIYAGSMGCLSLFQSTPSAWRETMRKFHASIKDLNFNPLPPHGGRPDPH